MKCSICNQSFDTINILFIHLRNTHLLPINTIIKCGQTNCPSSFSCLSSLKTHLIKKHRNLKNFICNERKSSEKLLNNRENIGLSKKGMF